MWAIAGACDPKHRKEIDRDGPRRNMVPPDDNRSAQETTVKTGTVMKKILTSKTPLSAMNERARSDFPGLKIRSRCL